MPFEAQCARREGIVFIVEDVSPLLEDDEAERRRDAIEILIPDDGASVDIAYRTDDGEERKTFLRTPLIALSRTAGLLLCDSELALIDVAAQAGFRAQGHFCGVFRRYTGFTPRSFRMNCRAEEVCFVARSPAT